VSTSHGQTVVGPSTWTFQKSPIVTSGSKSQRNNRKGRNGWIEGVFLSRMKKWGGGERTRTREDLRLRKS